MQHKEEKLFSPTTAGPGHGHRKRFSRGEHTGLLAISAALLLGAVDLRLATVPLALFLMLCAVAPFLPRAGFFFPVVSRGNTGRAMVALTFDDGPDPATTPLLLDLLARHRIPATFFVIGRRAAAYPELVRAIIAHGHEVGNHSFHHDNFTMFWRPARLAREVAATQKALAPSGITPSVFRPPVGITTPAMGTILKKQGLHAVNFSCRALDGGNRRIDRLSDKILSRIRPDDIVLLHDSHVGGPDRIGQWIKEVEKILAGIPEKGLTIVPLSRLTGQAVMHRDETIR